MNYVLRENKEIYSRIKPCVLGAGSSALRPRLTSRATVMSKRYNIFLGFNSHSCSGLLTSATKSKYPSKMIMICGLKLTWCNSTKHTETKGPLQVQRRGKQCHKCCDFPAVPWTFNGNKNLHYDDIWLRESLTSSSKTRQGHPKVRNRRWW